MQLPKPLGRERIAAVIIYISLTFLAFTVMLINVLDVKVKNIQSVDKGSYTVITERGPVNITSDNIIRIERTYTKAAITGKPVELVKIYTEKGFLYLSSLDPFYEIARNIMNSVDYYGLSVWERPNTDLQYVKPFGYAIGTPPNHIKYIFFLLSLQYLALSIGGITLLVLIMPFRWRETRSRHTAQIPKTDSEFCATEEQLGVVAK
ncbi:MAG: hypothetical protein M0T74_08310 [Desulfitobacterium hafniense]|nr:hypothetical protein [Desulfitobacterium hafniense]